MFFRPSHPSKTQLDGWLSKHAEKKGTPFVSFPIFVMTSLLGNIWDEIVENIFNI